MLARCWKSYMKLIDPLLPLSEYPGELSAYYHVGKCICICLYFTNAIVQWCIGVLCSCLIERTVRLWLCDGKYLLLLPSELRPISQFMAVCCRATDFFFLFVCFQKHSILKDSCTFAVGCFLEEGFNSKTSPCCSDSTTKLE